MAHPARRTYVVLVFLLNLFVAIRMSNPVARDRPARHVVARQRLAVVLLQVFSLLIVLVAPSSDRRGYGTWR